MPDLLVRCPNCLRDIAVPNDAAWHASIVHSGRGLPPQRVVRDYYGKVLHTCPIRLS
jgi:hypothetical protein